LLDTDCICYGQRMSNRTARKKDLIIFLKYWTRISFSKKYFLYSYQMWSLSASLILPSREITTHLNATNLLIENIKIQIKRYIYVCFFLLCSKLPFTCIRLEWDSISLFFWFLFVGRIACKVFGEKSLKQF